MIVSLGVVRLRLIVRIFARRVGGMHRLGELALVAPPQL
jgi:hypothetical protein